MIASEQTGWHDDDYTVHKHMGATYPGMTSPRKESLRSLYEIPLLEYLQADFKPVFIVDLDERQVVFENPPFQQWKQLRINGAQRADTAAFQDWMQTLAHDTLTSNHTYGGRAWTVIPLSSQWIVVSCQSFEWSSNNSSGRPAIPTSIAQRLNSRPRSAPTSSCGDDAKRRISVVSSSRQSVSETSDEDTARLHDWTRFNVPGLSAHVRMVKEFPWHTTTLGSMETWNDSLRTVVLGIMANCEPRVLLWGLDFVTIYNEASIPVYGKKHPAALGRTNDENWPEVSSSFNPMFRKAMLEGKPTKIDQMQLPMYRLGFEEETYWQVNLLPVIGPEGHSIAVLDEFAEITNQVLQNRKRDLLLNLYERLARLNTSQELWSSFLSAVSSFPRDIAYAMVYTPTGSSHESPQGVNTPDRAVHSFSFEGSVGVPTDANVLQSFDLEDTTDDNICLLEACRQAWREGKITMRHAEDRSGLLQEMAMMLSSNSVGQPVRSIAVVPIPDIMRNRQLAFLILGMSPSRPHDAEAAALLHHLADIVTRSVSAIFLPEEQRQTRQKFDELETSLSQQLRASGLEAQRLEARYSRMFQMAPVGMYGIDLHEKHIYFNDAYLKMTGIPREVAETGSQPPSDFVHEDDLEAALASWARCIQDKISFSIEYRVKKEWHGHDHLSGEQVVGETWLCAIGSPELDDNDNVLHITGFTLDISDRKYHEKVQSMRQETDESQARFRRLAETAPLGMYLMKPDGSPIYLNDAYFDTMGLTKEEFEEARERGVGWADQIHEDDVAIVGEAYKNLSVYGVPFNLEYRLKKPWKFYDSATGTEMTGPTWLHATAIAERDESGKPIAFQGWVIEISLKKFSERLLAERLEDALATKQQADRFIDMTSHEMRNPLSAILQSADAILTCLGIDQSAKHAPEQSMSLTGDSWEMVVESAQTIILCAQHQKRIVDDILTLSKLDSNLLVISPDKVSLPGLLEKCLKMYEAEIVRADIEVVLEVESSYIELGVDSVMLDSSRVLQVVINLLTNAIKFTQHSKRRRITIYIEASLSQPSGENHRASFIEQKPNRPDATSNEEWGTGEEVYLTIAVEDTGKGLTEDELKVLFHRFSQASPKTYKQYGGSGLGLFISRELTELQGGRIGVHSAAGKGSTFTFYVKSRRYVWRKNSTDLLQHAHLTKGSPIGSERKGSAASTNDSMPSLEVPSIPQRRRSIVAPRPQSISQPVPKARVDSGGLDVLVVEDNIINQRVMATQLRRLGCNVHVANHGVEALEFLRTTTFWNREMEDMAGTPIEDDLDQPIPLSMVLMDLEMPVLGGLGCVKQIRELQQEGFLKSHVPVIAITANARSEQITIAIQHGMDSVVTKPFRIPDLVPQMEALVLQLESQRNEA